MRTPQIILDEVAAVADEPRLYVRARFWRDAAAADAAEPAAAEEDFLLLPIPDQRMSLVRDRNGDLVRDDNGRSLTEVAYALLAAAGAPPILRRELVAVDPAVEVRRILEGWYDSWEDSQGTSRPQAARTAGDGPTRDDTSDPHGVLRAALTGLRGARVPHRRSRA